MVTESTTSSTSGRYAANQPPRAGRSVEPANVTANIAEAWAAAQAYIAAQTGRVKVLLRAAILYGALGILAMAVSVCVVITATVLLVKGIAESIALLLGGRQWAGDLITGVVVIFGMLIGGYIVIRIMLSSARSRTMSGYEKTIGRN